MKLESLRLDQNINTRPVKAHVGAIFLKRNPRLSQIVGTLYRARWGRI